MKTVNVGELKAHISSYLRRVRRGERFVVLDRREPVAQLGPVANVATAAERLALEGLVRPPTGKLSAVRLSSLERPVCMEDLLDEVREDRP